jgi:hypothetical protein
MFTELHLESRLYHRWFVVLAGIAACFLLSACDLSETLTITPNGEDAVNTPTLAPPTLTSVIETATPSPLPSATLPPPTIPTATPKPTVVAVPPLVKRARVSPTGLYGAVVMLAEGGQNYQLEVFNLENLNVVRRIPLLCEEIRDTLEEQGREAWYPSTVYRLVTDPQMLKWSPDGRYLAFVSAPDAQSTDVCVYDLDHDSVQCLTDGHYLTIVMSWSPDSRWIVYGEVAYYPYEPFYTDVVDEAVWTVSVTGNGARELYPAPPHQEKILGWTSVSTFVVETWVFEGSSQRLYEVNVETGSTQQLYSDPFDGAALDPDTETIMLCISGGLFGSPEIDQGLYRLDADYGPQLLFPGIFWQVVWCSEDELFAAVYEDNTCVTFTPGGEVIPSSEDRCRHCVSQDR